VKAFTRVVAFVIAVAVVLFALANRGAVTVSLAPLPMERDLPLYVVILLAFACGVAVGGLSHWFATGRRRRAAREEHRRLARVERELTEVHQQEGAKSASKSLEIA
jgi:uncharacterized integral membrane protein